MNFGERLIEEYVKRFEQKYSDSSIYNGSLGSMAKIDLKGITEGEVCKVIKPFLYEWGRMGRVLGRIEYLNWKSNLASAIMSNCQRLKGFSTKDLAGVKIGRLGPDIMGCYEPFKGAVGQIAAAKVLHLICPNFFPLWDNSIAEAVRNEIGDKSKLNEKVEKFSGRDYVRFMEKIQELISKYEKLLSYLASQHKKGKLKILDECLWWAAHMPASLLFEGKCHITQQHNSTL